MRSLVCGLAVVLVFVLGGAPAAHADVFLLKDGKRLHGWREKEYRDEFKQKWLSIRATARCCSTPRASST